jgi:Ca2+-binding EF-hand superfamily protein
MMKNIILLGAAAAALSATPASAQQGRSAERGAGITRAEVQTRVRDMFARVDSNRDGFVTQAEAQAFRGAARAERQNKRGERRESRFARLDANRDGSISRDEFFARADRGERRTARLERRGQRGGMMARLGGKRFERIDADKDGRISLAEVTTQRLRAFDRADANRDGRLTREERQAIRAERQARRG